MKAGLTRRQNVYLQAMRDNDAWWTDFQNKIETGYFKENPGHHVEWILENADRVREARLDLLVFEGMDAITDVLEVVKDENPTTFDELWLPLFGDWITDLYREKRLPGMTQKDYDYVDSRTGAK